MRPHLIITGLSLLLLTPSSFAGDATTATNHQGMRYGEPPEPAIESLSVQERQWMRRDDQQLVEENLGVNGVKLDLKGRYRSTVIGNLNAKGQINTRCLELGHESDPSHHHP